MPFKSEIKQTRKVKYHSYTGLDINEIKPNVSI